MKRIEFIQIQFLSYREKRGRIINLDHSTVIIRGGNGSGKSSIMKSLYYSLGAEIEIWPQEWLNANVIYLLKFKIDGIMYQSLRLGSEVTVYNCDGSFRFRSQGLWELAYNFSKLLELNFEMMDSDSQLKPISLGYLFAPFYIDQDRGWNGIWSSFCKLGIPNGKSIVQLFHSGIVTYDYNKKKNELIKVQKDIKECTQSIQLINKFVKQLKQQFSKGTLTYDIEKFKSEKEKLITKSEELKRTQKAVLSKLSELYNQKLSLEFQINQVTESIKEIEKDYNYALKADNILVCPICYSKIENDAIGRFEMCHDLDQSKDLKISLQEQLNIVNLEIDHIETRSQDLVKQLVEIQELLKIRKENYSFSDVIDSLVNQKLHDTIDDQEKLLKEEKNKKIILESELNETLKILDDKERKKMIYSTFESFIKKAYSFLKIPKSNPIPRKMTTQVKGVGSAYPRCIMAFSYSMLDTINHYSKAVFAPIVVDSPRQRAIDADTLRNFNNFLIQCRPEGSQLILGINDDDSFDDIDCLLITMEKEIAILNIDDYFSVKKNVEVLLGNSFFLK